MSETRYTFTIPLTQGKVALVEERDWYRLRKYRWHARWDTKMGSFYPSRNINAPGGGQKPEPMHRRIMRLSPGDGLHVDHENHNTLDNRRKNLRVVTPLLNSENRRDQSGYGAGVYMAPSGRFVARTERRGRRHHIGVYDTAEEATEARRKFLEERGLR